MLFNYSEFVQIFRESSKIGARHADEIEGCLKYCEEKAGKQFKENEEKIARKKLKALSAHFKSRWKKASRTAIVFEEKNKTWLESTMEFELSEDFSEPDATPQLKGPGRNEISFQQSSNRSKNRKRDRMIAGNENDPELFLAATIKVAKQNKQQDLAKILDSVMKEPDKKKMRKIIENPSKQYTPLEAVAIYVDNGETKATYHNLRMRAVENNSNLYPPYNVMAEEKKLCYPEGNFM
jgi:hypothetical protein